MLAQAAARLPLRLRQLNLTLRMVYVYTLPEAARRRAVTDIGRWLASGRPEFLIAQRLPLGRIAAAHERVESAGRIGHVVLDIP